ncbi:hypothetical protein FNV43_RR16103 [Rhamnella rubrinervis]|uniref:C2H2-type domain-containing protein n=1 Tax=Rhamnella rubrinervis TaxID=2594499 RepID=A0A8K0E2P8_9ROSA|nr:hypothetical protein FNV43_RR16103 [Rhamnella rubrinervis]
MEEEKATVCFPVRDVKMIGTIDNESKSNSRQHQLELGQSSNSKVGTNKTRRQHYLCKYCNKKFSTFQALGGHQNGHKYEKAALASQRKVSTVDAPTSVQNNATRRSFFFYPPAMEAPLSPSFNKNNIDEVNRNPCYCYFNTKSYAGSKGCTLVPFSTMNPPQTAVSVAVPQLRLWGDHTDHIHRAENGRLQLLATTGFNRGNSNYVPLYDHERKNDSSDMKNQQPGNLELDLSLKL